MTRGTGSGNGDEELVQSDQITEVKFAVVYFNLQGVQEVREGL